MITAALGIASIAFEERRVFSAGGSLIFQFANGARLYRILHYKAPGFYRPKLGKNKRRALYARLKKSRNTFFK
jgi:hypothetical protein